MSRLKPTEVRLVASLLQEEAEDAADLAGRIIQALDEKRARDDDEYVVVYLDPNTRTTQVFGAWSTQRQAERGIDRLASPGPLPGRAGVFRLTQPKE